MPDGLSPDGLQLTRYFVVSSGLFQQRSATITATAGGQSSTGTVTLMPVLISSFTAVPSSGTVGSSAQATVALSSAPLGGMHLSLVSADTSKATVSPTTHSVSAGTTSKVSSILLKGPVTSPRQVAITATLRAGGSGGPIVSQQTVVVTVNP
jgi:hypothetical protein